MILNFCRPLAIEVLKVLADVFVVEDPYRDDVNLVKLLNASESLTVHPAATGSTLPTTYSEDYLKHRVKEILVIVYSKLPW